MRRTQPGYKRDAFQTILPWDPAIDHQASDMETYLTTRDMKHVQAKQGEKLSIIHLRHLTKNEALGLEEMVKASGAVARRAACQIALLKIDNPKPFLVDEGVEVDPGTWVPEKTNGDPKKGTGSALHQTDLDLLQHDAVQDIGSVVLTRIHLVNGISLHFVPPPMSRQLCLTAQQNVSAETK